MSYVSRVVRIEIVVQKRCFYHRIQIYITNLCTAFDRPQLSVSKGCCVFIGHEYITNCRGKMTVVLPTGCPCSVGFWQGFAGQKDKVPAIPRAVGRGYK